MATISNTTLPTVENGQVFSEERFIEYEETDNSPVGIDEVLTLNGAATFARTDGAANPILGITVNIEIVSGNIKVTVAGDHDAAVFDSEVHHFTRGKSDKWEAPIVSTSFADVVNKNRQVYKWKPDNSSKSITFSVPYTSSYNGDQVALFTQTVLPNFDNQLEDFLNNI